MSPTCATDTATARTPADVPPSYAGTDEASGSEPDTSEQESADSTDSQSDSDTTGSARSELTGSDTSIAELNDDRSEVDGHGTNSEIGESEGESGTDVSGSELPDEESMERAISDFWGFYDDAGTFEEEFRCSVEDPFEAMLDMDGF